MIIIFGQSKSEGQRATIVWDISNGTILLGTTSVRLTMFCLTTFHLTMTFCLKQHFV
jgi:hypothetical protein